MIQSTLKNIPRGWKEVTLGKLFEFKNGVNSEKKNYGSGIRFINIMEILRYDFLDAEKIPGRITIGKKEAEKNLVRYGDVLFNRTSETPEEVGMTSVYLDTEPVVFGGFVIRGRSINKDLDDGFKKYCFSTQFVRREIIRRGQGAVRGNIGQGDLEKVPFLLPPLLEQKRIVALLETWDQAIEKLARKIEIKKDIKKGLMQELLTGKRRLPGFNDKWKVAKLGNLFERTRRILKKVDTPVYTISAKIGFQTQSEKFNRVIAGSSLGKYTYLTKGEFSYNKGNSKTYPYGCIYQFPAMSGLVPFVYISFRNRGKSDSEFYKHYFLFPEMGRQLKKMITSGVRGDGLLNVSVEDFFNCSVPQPTLPEQAAIANILSTMDRELSLLECKLSLLRDQKRYLLNNLVTGVIRTSEKLTIHS